MGLLFQLVDRTGDAIREVPDYGNRIYRMLPSEDDASFGLLRVIDPYDTIFNSAQMGPFLDEWRRLYERAGSTQDEGALHAVEELVQECQRLSTGHYLKVRGD